MAVLNKSGNNTVSDKFIYIEPNMVEGDTKKSVPMEDLMVYFDLRVEYVPKRHIVAAFGGEILHLQGIINDKKSFISVINGSKNKENESFFTTTAYGNYTLNTLKENGTEELFGVESIEVSYNSYMVPEVEIKFVDIKGAALHGAEELAHDDGGELKENISYSSKFLSSFFTVPFPRFELIIKGFYGKPVYYELSCADFRSSFDSKTGNYNAVARMVGYSYALISDITTCDILAAPYSSYYGKAYWEEQTQRGSFTSDGYMLPTLQDIVSTWNSIVAKVNEKNSSNISDERKQELQEEQNKLNNMAMTLSKINEYFAYVQDHVESQKLGKQFYNDEKKCLFILQIGSLAAGNYNNEFQLTTSRGVIGDGSTVMSKINLMKQYVGDNYCEWDKYVYSNVYEGTGDKSYLMGELTKIIEEKIKDSEKIEVLKNIIDETLPNSNELSITFHIFDFYDLVERLTKDIETKNSILNKTKDELNDELTKQLMNKLNFRPSLENVCKICFAHLETFLYMFQCVKNEEERKKYEIRFKGDVKTVQNIYPIFPLCMGEFYERGIKKTQEKWIGNLLPEKAEIKFVRGMMNGVKEGIGERLALPIDVAEKTFNRICPMDCINNKNPFAIFGARVLTDGFFKERCAQLFALGLHRTELNPQRMGELDAANYHALYPTGYDNLGSDIISEKWSKSPFKNIKDSDKYVDLSSIKIQGESARNLVKGSSEKLFKIVTDGSLDNCEMIGWFEGEEQTFRVKSKQNWDASKVDGCFNFLDYINDETAWIAPRIADNIISNIPFSSGGSMNDEYDSEGYTVSGQNICRIVNKSVDKKFNALNNTKTIACHYQMNASKYTIITIPSSNWGDNLFMTPEYQNENGKDGIKYRAFLFLHSFMWGRNYNKENGEEEKVSGSGKITEDRGHYYNGKVFARLVSRLLCQSKIRTDYKFIEVVPLFFVLKIGAILYCRQTNKQWKGEYYNKYYQWDDNVDWEDNNYKWFSIKNGYKETLIKFFTNWADTVYQKWDEVFSSTDDKVIKQLYYRKAKGVTDTYLLRDSHPIVKAMTEAFFTNVVWYKYNPMLIENGTIYNEKILSEIIGGPLKKKDLNEVYAIARNSDIKQYMQGFHSALQELYKDKVTEHAKSQLNESNLNDDMEFSLYRHYKQLWDRWVSNDNNTYINWKMEEVLGINSNKNQQRIHFIDCSYNHIGQDIIVNIGKFAELVSSMVEQRNMPFLTFLSYFFQDNNCVLHNIQNFYNTQVKDNVQNIFTPIPYYEIDWEGLKEYSDLLVMYKYQPADSYQDSFNITDNEQSLPSQYQNVSGDNYRIPAFGVVYGMQNQNYFSDIQVSMNTPNITDQVLQSTMKIADENSKEAASDTSTAVRTINKDMFQIYSNHSYECSVTMMGCAWIQPLMYFQLLNVPLFRGAYIIQKVSHSISAGNMVTKFTGTKISQRALKLPNQTSLVLKKNMGSQPSTLKESEYANVSNDCPYAYFMPNKTAKRTYEEGEYKEEMLKYLDTKDLKNETYTIKQMLGIQICGLIDIVNKEDENLKFDTITYFVFLFHNFWVQVRKDKKDPLDVVDAFIAMLKKIDEITESVEEIYNNNSDLVETVVKGIERCINDPLTYYNEATRTWKEKPHLEKINGVILKNQNKNGEKIEINTVGNFVFISNAYGGGNRSYFSLESTKSEYAVDEMIDVFNKTLSATKGLTDVLIEKVNGDIPNKIFLKINKEDADARSNVFDMILQTYAKPYLKSLLWVAKDENSAHEPWQYICIEMANQSTNLVVGVYYLSSQTNEDYDVSIIDDYENLHEHFYTSLMKKYSINLTNQTMNDAFKLDCLNFAPLTSDEKWKEKVLQFFGENEKTKNVKVKSCNEVKNENIHSSNGGSYGGDDLKQMVYDDWQFSGTCNDYPTPLKFYNPNQIYSATIREENMKKICADNNAKEEYSVCTEGDNGSCEMNKRVKAYGQYAWLNSLPKGQHKCAQYVRTAIENALTFSTEGRPNSACRYSQILGYWGYRKIYEGPTSKFTNVFKEGDIIVIGGKNLLEYDGDGNIIEPVKNSDGRIVSKNRKYKFGHIQIYYPRTDKNGEMKNWYADSGFVNANVYTDGDRPCCIFRAMDGLLPNANNTEGIKEENGKVYYGDEFIYDKSNGGMNWQPSENIIKAIKTMEGFRGEWYIDMGKNAIGYGFNEYGDLNPSNIKSMTEEEADKYLREKIIPPRVKKLKDILQDMMFYNQNQMDALFSLLYNIGDGMFKDGSPNLMNGLKNRNIEKIVENMDHGLKNTNASGLKKRRMWEQKLFKTPLNGTIEEFKW